MAEAREWTAPSSGAEPLFSRERSGWSMAEDEAESSAAMRVGHWVDNAVTTAAVVMGTMGGVTPAALSPSSADVAAARVAESTSQLATNESRVQQAQRDEAMEAMQADDDVIAAEHTDPPDSAASDLWGADSDDGLDEPSADMWKSDADEAGQATTAEAWGSDANPDIGPEAGPSAGDVGDVGGAF